MLDLLKKSDFDKLQQLTALIKKIDPRAEVVVKKKKSYVWLIVLLSFLALAGIGVAVYYFFFDSVDDFEDFDDEDFEEIDFDDDYDDFEDFEDDEEEDDNL